MRIIKPLLLFGQDYLRIYGRLAVNSFALRVDNKGEEENVGTGIVTNFIFKKIYYYQHFLALYRASSIFDHSCSPNATTVFRPGEQGLFSTKYSFLVFGIFCHH